MIGASGNIASLRVGAQLAWRLTSLQLRDRYASTLFGSFWAVLQPAALIAVYWFVFSYGLRASNPSEHTPFFLVLIAGLVVWFFFSDAVLGGTTAVTAASYLVKKIAFPLEVLPFVPVLSALSIHGVMLLIVLGFMVSNGIFPDLHTLWFAYYMVALLCLSVGLSCLLSAINVFQKDIGQAAGILMQIWFWLTPIVWSPDLFPETVRKWLELNPLYYIVMGYRQALFPDLKVVLSWQSGVAFWAFTIVSMLVGSTVFRRLKPDFADFL